MAPCNGTTSTLPNLAVTLSPNHSTLQSTIAPCNCAQLWHHVHSPKVPPQPWHTTMAPSNGTTSTPPKLAVTLPPTIPHYNGTQQWHHVHCTLQWHPGAPLPQSWSSPSPQPYHTTMAPYDGTQQWHHVHCTLQWHPGATSNQPKCFVALPPIGSKNPYSYRYLGNNHK